MRQSFYKNCVTSATNYLTNMVIMPVLQKHSNMDVRVANNGVWGSVQVSGFS